MPYGGYRRRYRRSFGRKNYSRGRAPLARKAMRSVGKLWKRVKAAEERKFFITDTHGFTDQIIPTTPLTTVNQCVHAIDQGTTESTRTGDKISAQALLVNVELMRSLPSSQIVSQVRGSVSYRLMVVRDLGFVGTAIDLADLFSDFTAGDLTAHYNPDHMGSRFEVLYDQTKELGTMVDNTGGTEIVACTGTLNRSYHFKVNVRNKPIRFDGAGATIGDMGAGSIFVLMWGNSANAEVTGQVTTRFTYLDS